VETRFGDVNHDGVVDVVEKTNAGSLRYIYFFILFSHIMLAAVVLPLVLISLYRGLTGQIAKHKKITRWSFPIWLYVTTTGVIVYLLISPYYNF
jgi:putative membrane protein